MPVYNKLVRDLIPDIIASSGKTYTTHTLNDDEYLAALNAKLDEELAEYREADMYREADESYALEELADILEVLYAIAKAKGFSIDDLEAVRAKKAEKRGGFSKQIMLDEVYDTDTQ